MDKTYKVVSLFSGAGGLDLGFLNAGFKIIWANEIDKYSCSTYRKNIGDHIIESSIYELDYKNIPDCDVLIGGPPCQGFSVAGKMDINDPRSKLIWEFFNVVNFKRPRFFVMENVPSFGTLTKFQDIRRKLFSEFNKIGYKIKFEILNSKYYNVPQNRSRFILIGTINSIIPIQFPTEQNKIISTREAIQDLGEPETGINFGLCKAKITVAQYPVLRKSPYAGMLFNGLGRPIDLDKPAPTLPASMGGNKTPIIEENILKNPNAESWVQKHHELVSSGIDFDAYEIEVPPYLRRLTIREAARIQSFPDSFTFSGSKSQMWKQIGNAVPPKLSYYIANAVKASLEERTIAIENQLSLNLA